MSCCDNSKCKETAVFFSDSLADTAMKLIDTTDICDKVKSRMLIHLAHTLTVTAHALDSAEHGKRALADLDNSCLMLVPQEAVEELMPIIHKHVREQHGD